MKIAVTTDGKQKQLTLTPDTVEDAFQLGELWGAWAEKIDVALGRKLHPPLHS